MIEFRNLYGGNSSLTLKLVLLFNIIFINTFVISCLLSSELWISTLASLSLAVVMVTIATHKAIVRSTRVGLLSTLLLSSLLVLMIIAYSLW